MISRLSLSDFRNHHDALIVPHHPFVVLTGDNGAGKTNILEAISLLAPGRGLRGASLSAMARQDGPGSFGIAAQADGVTIGTGIRADQPERRLVRINGVASAVGAMAEHLALVWLTPAMDRLFVEGATGRRRFLDRLTLALHPHHAHHATRYEAAMRSRNKLLSDDRSADPQWLAALEMQMGEHGAAVAEARNDLVLRVGAILADMPDTPFARPIIKLAGWQLQDNRPLEEELREGRGRDKAAGRTLAGPHRSDLAVVHAEKGQPAAECSTGEQKALMLSLLLAHASLIADMRGRPPLLLLDEIAAHLDPRRRAALFDRLAALGGQIWMTGTEASLFEGLDTATKLFVRHGQVSAD